MEENFKDLEILINDIEKFNSANDLIDSINKYQEGLKILDDCKKKEKFLKFNEEKLEKYPDFNLNSLVKKIEKKIEKLPIKFENNNINIDDFFTKLNDVNNDIKICNEALSESILQINKIIKNNNSYSITKFE